MMKKLLLPLLCTSLLYAETLEELIRKVEVQNLTLQQEKLRVFMQSEREVLAATWENPKLTLGANDLLLDDIATRNREPMQTHFLSLSQKIPTGDKIALQKAVAAETTRQANARYRANERKLLSTLRRYAWRVAIVEKRLSLIAHYRNNLHKLQRLHRQRLAVGKGSQSLIEESGISLERLAVKKRRLLTQKADLLDRISTLVEEDVSSVQSTLQMRSTPKIAIDTHPALEAQQIALQQAKTRVRLARAQRLPDVTVGVGYFQRVNRSDYLSVSAAMPLPVRARERQGVKIALLAQQQQQAAYKKLRFRMQKEAKQLLRTLEDAKESYNAITKTILPKKRYLQKLLTQELYSKNISATTLIRNLNEAITLELDACDELERYFDALAKLYYFSGEK